MFNLINVKLVKILVGGETRSKKIVVIIYNKLHNTVLFLVHIKQMLEPKINDKEEKKEWE